MPALSEDFRRNGIISIARERDERGDWNVASVTIDGEAASITDALRIMGSARSTTTRGVSVNAGGRVRQVEYAYEL